MRFNLEQTAIHPLKEWTPPIIAVTDGRGKSGSSAAPALDYFFADKTCIAFFTMASMSLLVVPLLASTANANQRSLLVR